MMNRTDIPASIALLAAAVLLAPLGCEKKPAPPPRSASSGSGSMEVDGARSIAAPARAELKLHPKVQFPDERRPESPETAQAIADLAAAIADGSADALQALVSPADQIVLKMLVDSGEWKRRSEGVKTVRVCVVNPGSPVHVGLGVEDASGAILMGWSGGEGGSSMRFSNLPIEAKSAQAAKDLDGAELTMLGLPSGTASAGASIMPEMSKKIADADSGSGPKKSSPAPQPSKGPPGLIPDKH